MTISRSQMTNQTSKAPGTKGPTKKRDRKYKSNKKKNPAAKAVRSPKYKQRVVPPGKVYKRKKSNKRAYLDEI